MAIHLSVVTQLANAAVPARNAGNAGRALTHSRIDTPSHARESGDRSAPIALGAPAAPDDIRGSRFNANA